MPLKLPTPRLHLYLISEQFWQKHTSDHKEHFNTDLLTERATYGSQGGRMGEGIVRESGMDMDTLVYLTWRTSKDLLDSTGNSAQYSVMTLWFPGGRMGEG